MASWFDSKIFNTISSAPVCVAGAKVSWYSPIDAKHCNVQLHSNRINFWVGTELTASPKSSNRSILIFVSILNVDEEDDVEEEYDEEEDEDEEEEEEEEEEDEWEGDEEEEE